MSEKSSETIKVHVIPEWFNKNYMENVLKHYKQDDTIKILTLDVVPATNKGDNYASLMFRVHLKYSACTATGIQEESFVTKMPFQNDELANATFEGYDIYKKELDIYKQIFPKYKDLLRKSNDDDYDIFPASIYVDYDHNLLMFEDLCVRNFVLVNRQKGLDLIHTKMVLEKLAKMHAASAVFNELYPDILKAYDRGIFNRHSNAFAPFFVNNLDMCAQVLQNLGNHNKYADKLMNLKPKLMEYGNRTFDPNSSHFNVLIHGDLWINNIMFKYDEHNEPVDAILLDFQCSCWTSPAIDLHYFFNTSLSEDVRLNNLDELVQFYYNNLADTLRSLNYKGKIPTLHEFWIQYIEKRFYAFTSACLVHPFMLNENTDNADFAAFLLEDERAVEFKKMVYTNEKVLKNLKYIIPIFERQGLFDVE